MASRVFHELNKFEQDEVRRKYKNERSKDYKKSIYLYIIYVIEGVAAIIGMAFMYFYSLTLGLSIFLVSFILLVWTIYLLKKSNKKFFEFLQENGMSYDKKSNKK